MRGHIFISIVGLFIFCLLLFTVSYFIPLFSIRFGGKPEWYIVVIGFLRTNPFNIGKAGDTSVILVFINSLFWTICIGTLLYFILRKKNNKAAH